MTDRLHKHTAHTGASWHHYVIAAETKLTFPTFSFVCFNESHMLDTVLHVGQTAARAESSRSQLQVNRQKQKDVASRIDQTAIFKVNWHVMHGRGMVTIG